MANFQRRGDGGDQMQQTWLLGLSLLDIEENQIYNFLDGSFICGCSVNKNNQDLQKIDFLQLYWIFKASALWPDAFIESQCQSVSCDSVCLSVSLSHFYQHPTL